MRLKEDLMFDFALNMPRALVSGNTVVLDNVKRLLLMTDESIVVDNGRRYTSLKGTSLEVRMLKEERMWVCGDIEEIRFFRSLQEGEA
jgi:sporulation protein YqfC